MCSIVGLHRYMPTLLHAKFSVKPPLRRSLQFAKLQIWPYIYGPYGTRERFSIGGFGIRFLPAGVVAQIPNGRCKQRRWKRGGTDWRALASPGTGTGCEGRWHRADWSRAPFIWIVSAYLSLDWVGAVSVSFFALLAAVAGVLAICLAHRADADSVCQPVKSFTRTLGAKDIRPARWFRKGSGCQGNRTCSSKRPTAWFPWN